MSHLWPALCLIGLGSCLLPWLGALEPAQALESMAESPPERALSDLARDPLADLGEEVRLVLQFGAPLASWNPYLTRFGAGDFAGYEAWGDERFLWERAAFDAPERTLFARRGSSAERVLADAKPYQRFLVRAVVREVFLGKPWIEILAAERLAEEVSEGSLLHAIRGLELLAEGQKDLARAQIERAAAGFLPAHARAELERLAELAR
jgi:hypothetical protein